MSDVRIISEDSEVLDYSELFRIRHRLEKYLKDKVECTLVRQLDMGNGIISISIFSVHTLTGDSGFTCLIFPDKVRYMKDIEEFLSFKEKVGGFKSIRDDGGMDDNVVGLA